MNRAPPIAIFISLLIISTPFTFAAELGLTYDANGNLVTGDGKYRTYNSLNQLNATYNGSSSSGTLLETYVYHPSEERIWYKKEYWPNSTLKTTTYYLSESVVRVVNQSGTTDFRYVHHQGQLVAQNASGVKLYVHGNAEGSSSVVTNSSGSPIENVTYSPYGEQLNASVIRYGYESKEYDSLVGDTDFRFRKYRADLGMFTQPDSLIPNVYDPQQLNRYSFERNNPYKYVDEDGHNPVYAGAFAIGFAFGAVSYGWEHMGEGRGSVSNFVSYMGRGIGHGLIGGAVGVGTVAFGMSAGRIAATSGGIGFLRGAGMMLVGAAGYAADQAVDGNAVDYGDMAISAVTNGLPTGVPLNPGSLVSPKNPFASNTLKLFGDQVIGNIMNTGGHSYLTYVSDGSSYGTAVVNTILNRPGVQLNRGGHSAKFEYKTSNGKYPTNNPSWRPRAAGTPGGKGGGSHFG